MKWSQQTWQAALPVYNEILSLPFVRELAAGTLSRERFIHYITQDSLYIVQYSRVLAHIASRLADNAFVADFAAFAGAGVAVEQSLHEGYLAGADTSEAIMAPACMLYTSWLKAQAYAPVEVEAAAVLPCFWVYKEVGEAILRMQSGKSNPYHTWIECYGDKSFETSTLRAIEICDVLADGASEAVRRAMTEAFVEATKMEWRFWNGAYNLEKQLI